MPVVRTRSSAGCWTGRGGTAGPSDPRACPAVPGPVGLLRLQRAAGNRAVTTALCRGDPVVQRLGETDTAGFFTGRREKANWTDEEWSYLYANNPKTEKNRHERWMRMGGPAASAEELREVLRQVTAKELDAFVKDAYADATSFLGKTSWSAVAQQDPVAECADRLAYVYYVTAKDRLTLDAMKVLLRAEPSVRGATLLGARRQQDAKKDQAEKERLAHVDRVEKAAAELSALCSAAFDWKQVRAFAGLPGGEQLLELAVRVAGHKLMIHPEGLGPLFTGLFDEQEEGRFRGVQHEVAEAMRLLDVGHIIQMGTMKIKLALSRMESLDLAHDGPSWGPRQYLMQIRSKLEDQGTVGADIVDWTTYAPLQLKHSKSASPKTAVKHIHKALLQVTGTISEIPPEQLRMRRQARVTLTQSFDPAKLMTDATLSKIGSDYRDSKTLSVALIIQGETTYFIPGKDGTWKPSKNDPVTFEGWK